MEARVLCRVEGVVYKPQQHKEGDIMATSSIGQPVILTEERAKRLMDIMSRPHKLAKSKSGRKLKTTRVSDLGVNPKKFK